MFSELLKRANLSNIQEFIINGGDFIENPEDKPYDESVREAERAICKFIESYFTQEERDKVSDIIYSQIDILQRVYFEIGLLVGMKLSLQVCEKIKEIL